MDKQTYEQILSRSQTIQASWKTLPAPKRGEAIRLFTLKVRAYQSKIADQITAESRKIHVESLGEVREAIDMGDFALGLSRQLYGLTMPSERPQHRLQEIWHPLGVVGVISAFNFPMAVWAWNHCLAIVCGNSVVWKPSPKTLGVAKLCKQIWDEAIDEFDASYRDLLLIVEGDHTEAEWMADDRRIALLSATGSTSMGKAIAPRVAARLGRGLYELGGNNAAIISPFANLDLALRAIVFSAVGTCGQRCTTLRRAIIHQSVYEDVVDRLKQSYLKLPIGDPSDPKTAVGPLISPEALAQMQVVLGQCRERGYSVLGGEPLPQLGDAYVKPALVEVASQDDLVAQETFAPVLYLLKYDELDDEIAIQNGVPQGLSSCIFTDNLQEAERFISESGSDCGIVNVNIGPSGAEIGGAFGGEKETGGGRESGSDAWKQYMRRATVSVNYGRELPLAQGIEFNWS